VEDDRGRLYNHIISARGDIRLVDLRPRHIRDFVETDELIAPRARCATSTARFARC
jgi:hypothetical protein